MEEAKAVSECEYDEEGQGFDALPPLILPPIARVGLESRAKVLEELLGTYQQDGAGSRKRERTRRLADITEEQIREVGGGV